MGDHGLRRLDALARRSPLVLAMDFDGTLARIDPRPSRARLPGSLASTLRALARMDGVILAVISGRSLADLKQRCPIRGAKLVGAHGLESGVKGVGMSALESRRWRSVLRQAKQRIAPLGLGNAGRRFEDKGLGLALHLGQTGGGRSILPRLTRALAGLPVEVRPGLRLLELRPAKGWGKGRALHKLVRACAPDWRRKGACLFAGDDSTDEDAFLAMKGMGPQALSLKIGQGPTAARHRIQGPQQFWRLLERIRRLRAGT